MNPDTKIAEANRRPDDDLERFIDDPAHVLLAEDDADLRQMIAAALRADGFHVIETENGKEFLENAADWLLYRWPYEQIDVIVTDVRMPGMSGTDVVSSLRRAHWNTPVILVTAFADAQLYRDAKDLDVAAIVEKPFDIDVLRAAVSNAVARRAPASAEPA